ncbi:MAG TPA: DHA2 family efflux MFS transporter permease subunit [Verrucomicrobiae bacterium]|nr:DHA2 family efflux MFS transporter permease subunit [Verrucomicrobiae bacterium]
MAADLADTEESPITGAAGVAPALAINKWVIAATVMFGTFMAVMDISVVNVALPHMMGSFGEDLSTITWVATSYSIAEIIMATMAGWWSTVLGRKRLYMFSYGLFTLGSVLCGTARSFPQMLFYRVLQGVGGGSLIPVSQAILREAFPAEEQGMAMAMYGMGVVLAPAIGPIVGGWLTDHYGWPWIFFINVPVSVIGMLMVVAFVHDPHYLRRGVRKIDWGGITLLTITLTGLQIVLERGQEKNWFESNWIVLGSIITALAFVALLIWELRASEPIINLRLLRNVPLTVGCTLGLIFGVGLYSTTFILPQFTQDLLGYPAFEAGMVLFPRAISLFLVMPLAGLLYRHVDARWLVLLGLGFIFWSFYDLAHLTLDVGVWNLVPILLIMGAGMPFMFVTLTTVSLSTVDRSDMTEASSFYTLTRRVGGNIGYALVATIIARRAQFHRAQLVEHVSAYNVNFHNFLSSATAALAHRGLNLVTAKQSALVAIDRLVNRQATMLAYNDTAWIIGLTFLMTVPMVLLLPGRHQVRPPAAVAGD